MKSDAGLSASFPRAAERVFLETWKDLSTQLTRPLIILSFLA